MTETMQDRRARLMGPNVPTFYREPLHLVRGEGVWLWDKSGKRYLDCYNNVPHVGHCHPHVVQAICAQAGQLNTHTRYLHDTVLEYIDRLGATFGHGTTQAIMTCTGSEANDIALRMAQAVTGKTGIIATDNTYHGNTALVSQLSTRKPPIGGYAKNVKLVPAPDSRVPVGGTVEGQAAAFAANVARAVQELEADGFGLSGMLICPLFANEGLPDLAPGFLDPTVAVIRAAGGLMIADEVQPGFGRSGSHFWGHDRLGFAPDVVTMGKPMGNGHPVAAVFATPRVMGAFRDAFGYFNTFGGNPVSAAAAMAVLDVIEREGLQDNARTTGAYMVDRLRAVQHPWIAQVRGAGQFYGVEFVTESGAPATAFVADVIEGMVANGVILNNIGKHRNTLKMRPPMPFGREHADIVVDTLVQVLAQTPVRG
ncbi:MAG: aminotransferase class III-fold pyridoxal phosphate-dependent enzyme [Gemmobacter sp.]|nr:aminotransferase class III-fold pyridoxal phosphate-dependent enzyme [Gemmobacter sp.]